MGLEGWVEGGRASKTLEPGCPWKWEQKVENEELKESQRAEVPQHLPALG